jgi:hypothetical protein
LPVEQVRLSAIEDTQPSDERWTTSGAVRVIRPSENVDRQKLHRALGNVFGDQLLHGWDLAVSTGQDPTMPEGLPEAANALLHGRFTEEQRKGVLKPEISIAPESSAQDKLLAYSGRDPSRRA